MFLVCGEALFDFFLESEDGAGAALYAARAGGSPFNVALGLARLGEEVGLLSAISSDLLGQRLRKMLSLEGVAMRYALETGRPTTISLVGVSTDGVPAYQFYGAGSADTGVETRDLPDIEPSVVGLHFGSYSLVVPPVADAFAYLAQREQTRFISLDPNVRPTVERDMAVWDARIRGIVPYADVVKISAEDIATLAPGQTAEKMAADLILQGAKMVVVTDGGGPARGWTASGLTAEASPPPVTVIDTVGAGDTFQAALIHRLLSWPGGPHTAITKMDSAQFAEILGYAARAASITCSRRGADLPHAAEMLV
jgi:fructokinase